VPEPPMLLHLLAVRCPACGARLTFIRLRGYGDLYECSGGSCKCRVMHYRNKATQTCGWALLYNYASLGVWTACDVPAAMAE
jgi:hypothetical protein